MKKNCILLVSTVLFSCNDRQRITRDEIIGKYEHLSTVAPWNGVKNSIELNIDSTFKHSISRNDSIIVKEIGIWKYRDDYNLNLITFDSFTNYIQYQTEEMIKGETSFTVKKLFGGIYLPVIIPYDPDGSPIVPKYKKVK
ncbi:hypothetical protein EZS27_007811 [termite gut metagenome]|uniref:Uncharacterized protein n=1 Tax=termite gut metagenome TaxID=433724 RepID=A0A5J4SEW8_9ZZZZ